MQVTDCMAQGRLRARANSVQLYLWLMSQSYNPMQAYGQGPHCATGSHSGPRPLSFVYISSQQKEKKERRIRCGRFLRAGMAVATMISTAFRCLELGHEATRLPGGEGLGELVWLCAQQMGPASI